MKPAYTCPICQGNDLSFHRFGFTESQYQDYEKYGIRCPECNSIFLVDEMPIKYNKGNDSTKWRGVEESHWFTFAKQTGQQYIKP